MSQAEMPVTSIAVIETDAFCERCGFNLRSQPIWRDGRLGLLVCRCPECGAHQSATGRASALTPWLHRLALLATVLWVALSLAYAAALFGSLFGLQAMASEQLTTYSMRTPDGAPVNYNWQNGKQTIVGAEDRKPVTANRVIIRRELLPFLGGPPASSGNYSARGEALAWFLVGTAFFGACIFFAASLVAAGTWFWRPMWRWIWVAMPIAAATLVVTIVLSENRSPRYVNADEDAIVEVYDHRTEVSIVAIVALGQTLMFAAALRVGRKLVRGVLLVFAPPGVRQLFAFLWHCDGKTMPPVRAAAAAIA